MNRMNISIRYFSVLLKTLAGIRKTIFTVKETFFFFPGKMSLVPSSSNKVEFVFFPFRYISFMRVPFLASCSPSQMYSKYIFLNYSHGTQLKKNKLKKKKTRKQFSFCLLKITKALYSSKKKAEYGNLNNKTLLRG